jgi:hypothetical protein
LFEIAGHVIPPEQKAQMEQKQASPPRPLCPKNIDFAQPRQSLTRSQTSNSPRN